MVINFYKYHGTGNDFIMVDNRTNYFPKNDTNFIKMLCHRRFGIGADGLILLENSKDEQDDFKMIYFNADGNPSSMCGNGGRCIVSFANFLKIISETAEFTAVDGKHFATINNDEVSLKMKDVSTEDLNAKEIFIDTGSPHRIIFCQEVGDINIKKEGSKIRFSSQYEENGGTNVNYVQQLEQDTFLVRTYERGVEDETYSCGTGVTAVALAVNALGRSSASIINLKTPGGDLKVRFKNDHNHYSDIWLTGPTKNVFKGSIECPH